MFRFKDFYYILFENNAKDVALPGAVFNAGQGAWEGLADELEQNGLEGFDWGRAGQNMLTGAATGAITGALNKGVSNKLAQNGGNLFKGNNALTRGINNLGSNTALGRVGSTVATGAARGALSGAVGGATGAGLQSALNGQDIGTGISNAFQGAVQGAGQGALTGGAMAGMNMAANATPGVGNVMRKLNQAGDDWQNSGDNFAERWQNTRSEDTWGNRFLNNRAEDVRAIGQGVRNVGEGLGALAKRGADAAIESVDNTYSNMVNKNAKERLAAALIESIENEANGGTSGNTKFVRLTNDKINDANILRKAQGIPPLEQKQVIAYENAINHGLNKRLKQGGMTVDDVVDMVYDSLMSPNAEALPGNVGSSNTMMVAPYKDRYNGSMIDNFQGTTSLKSIEPRSANKVNAQRAIKNALLGQSGSPLAANPEGGVTQTSSLEGSTSVGENTAPLGTRNSIVSQNNKNVNSNSLTPKDLVDAYNAGNLSETELVNAWDTSDYARKNEINDYLSTSKKWRDGFDKAVEHMADLGVEKLLRSQELNPTVFSDPENIEYHALKLAMDRANSQGSSTINTNRITELRNTVKNFKTE